MNNSQIRYEIFLKVAELGNITLAAEVLSYTQSGVSHAIAAMEREAGCTLFHRSKTGVTLTESGKALLPLVQDLVNKQHSLDQAMDFTPLFDDPMLVIMAPGHELAKKKSLPLRDLKKYPMISQFQGSDHDVRQIYKKARMRPQTKYILNDDISVMGLAAQEEAIALMPAMMLETASFDLKAIPLDPPQHRTIGLATLPIKETTLLVRTFIAFCRNYSFD